MKKKFAVTVFGCASTFFVAYEAYAYVLAFFTGQQEFVQTVTGKSAIRCHYQYNGQEFTKLYDMGQSCPSSIEIE
ncbi:hypothetical protein [Robbsia andropogonis]|uniref:hypothetical protein n=1 Tax=Robbsia andropogonis TaxID=28092 RepID=UPI000463D794|nr:hypothetical protein [Robbsia andropogonis]